MHFINLTSSPPAPAMPHEAQHIIMQSTYDVLLRWIVGSLKEGATTAGLLSRMAERLGPIFETNSDARSIRRHGHCSF